MLTDTHDETYMLRAISLAEQGRQTTAPNPWVGCVVVAPNGEVVAEGFHVRKGGPHAERVALANLPSPAPQNCCMYVTLEPCCHVGSTSPCADALIASSNTISRVVVALLDPDSKVSGKGIARIRAAGMEVVVGVCEGPARDSLRPYLFQRTYGRPYVVGKLGMSVNGVISSSGERWITSEQSREEGMHIRRSSQAIIVGVNTVLHDNPMLTQRSANQSVLFYRVVIDPKFKLQTLAESTDLNILTDSSTPTLIFGLEAHHTPSSTLPHVEYVLLDTIDLSTILTQLAERGVLQVLVEGGATTISKFIEEELVNELTLFVAPVVMRGLNFFNSIGPKRFLLKSAAPVIGRGDIRIDYFKA